MRRLFSIVFIIAILAGSHFYLKQRYQIDIPASIMGKIRNVVRTIL